MKKLGIVGGLGPMATVIFMKRIIDMTEASCDQEHIDMIVEHYPSIPDRTAYILDNKKENPLPRIREACRSLESAGAEIIAIPCVTAHYFHDSLTAAVNIPVMDGAALSAEYLSREKIGRVGIMATDGTVKSGIFSSAFEKSGAEIIYPDEALQKYVMDLIYEDVKRGKPVEKEKFEAVSKELFSKGADVILLGCTELSVIAQEWLPAGRFLDVLDVLSMESVRYCGRLKAEHNILLRGDTL